MLLYWLQSHIDDGLRKTMPEIGEWNNEMAKGMMPLQDEQDAFDLDEKEEAANGTAMQS
jgi:hypothetical protein